MLGRSSIRAWHPGIALGAVTFLGALSAFGGRQVDADASDASSVAAASPLPINPTDARPLEDIALVGQGEVEDWIERLSTRDRSTAEMVLARLGRYEQLISDRLAMRGMPAALLYVPAIESALSATARSSADAVGLWQLREETAVELGLRVDEWIDERRDPVRATDAALDYLERLHARFGSWELALLAYNAGPSRVASRVRWYAPRDADAATTFRAVIGRLPRETRNYLPKLLATRVVAESAAARFAYDPIDTYAYDDVVMPPRTSLWKVAEAHRSTLVELRALNPHLMRYSTPPSVAYPVRVPVGTSAEVVAVLRGIRSPGEPAA